MENGRINVEYEQSAQVGSYGYNINFTYYNYLNQELGVSVLITRPDSSTLTKTGTIVDADNGIVSYTVEEGDFTIPATYKFQIVQAGDNYLFKSPIAYVPVSPSL